ncbi:MAG: 16S rRNA (uracil(1498)-N(3))-methyltransferase [Betaproteobacteria bacterium]|nr:16S rRNA (uracil(1498)-N(3))-methyltransferase [Betaproteobacteria bacterium]MDH5219683.1 16S rRNA (uracil(1498)-N(3))-methyltransferase [Betaproteobacteria bacterium]
MPHKPARAARFHADLALRAGGTVILPGEAAHHAVHVLRLRAGDEVTLFDGRGGEYAGRIAAIERLRVSVEVLAHRALERESPLAVTLVQGVSAGEKMDFTVQKATELGVGALQPVVCERSTGRIVGERAAQKRAHWQRVAIAACEQCGRNRVPQIHAPLALEQYCRDAMTGNGLLLSPEARIGLREAAARLGKVMTLAAGPESGFTAAEEALLVQSGFVPIRLGPRVLRTETAALAALAALNALAGDF